MNDSLLLKDSTELVATMELHRGFTHDVAVDMVEAEDMADDGVSAQCDLAERAQVELLYTHPVTDTFHQVLETCRGTRWWGGTNQIAPF